VTSRHNRLIEEYLHRFDNASVFLAADRREELRQEIVEHIDAGLEEADALHAEASRAVLERLGPPADIVAAELGGSRSTGSTPMVKHLVPVTDVARKHEIHHEGQVRQAQDDVAALPVVSPPSRRRVTLLIGAAATAFVAGVLAFGISTNSSDPAPAFEVPAIAPSQSEGFGGELPSGLPTDGHDVPTTPFSYEPSEILDGPTASAT
jgi:hypothetical protein